ncbi:nucleic acid-binding protein (plasmid) [Exiguobacterium sp. N4-1P]|uniref:nucleic acid-binding protein n=1 Tax=Exiguobacterium sp. N4-1P TaxID=2051906 RepID=UPI000B58CCAF|nr:nucleic acid-binding protein [Exiguobacterium sp. N4-1P]ASI35328.1 nucleic acid-binding protein [Exiguobacterium sp. N4-1P]ASI37341.1 nucleic acid-binding protein [Exiguobacterium sp. N4-1P]
MNRTCTQCDTRLVEDCEVHVKGAMYGLKIKKPGRFFSKASAEAKAAVCPKCGLVQLYVDQPNAFLKT